jgi:chromosome segregation ATPase
MEANETTLWRHISDTSARLATIDGKLDTLLAGSKKTDERVGALEVAYNSLETDMRERDSELKNLIEQVEKNTKIWTLKALLVVNLLGSFVWIKESRDVIGSIIKAIL